MSNNRYKILVVEDDAHIMSLLTALLEASDYQALMATTCREAQMMFASHTPDLVILDLGLPDEDGKRFIAQVRESAATPIIVLSARSDEKEKVDALDTGANDYVTKPFSTAELMARVRSELRANRHGAADSRLPGGRFTCPGLEINYDSRRVYVDGQEVHLTQMEYNILALLSEHRGEVVTYKLIIREIWGATDAGSTKKLQVNMANIRKKLGEKPGAYRFISNELGVGYRFCEA